MLFLSFVFIFFVSLPFHYISFLSVHQFGKGGTHTYGDWKVTKEATETEEGSRERGCAVCEYVQTEAIPAAGTGSPQTGDSSDMALWISLMLASCGGVLGMLFYRRKKAVAGK